jgi:AcrR family transcriptional regulator
MSAIPARLPADDRRRLIVDVALQLLAREGFEGLRTREIAAAARINTATLHHYFATKEDVVAAVAERLAELFQTVRAPAVRGEAGRVPDALRALRQQFEDVAYYGRARPELVAAYRELVGRASRDEATRRIVERLNTGWRDSVAAIITRGRADGTFREDCEPRAVAELVVAASWGFLVLLQLSPAGYRHSCRELERGLLAEDRRSR